MKPFEARLTAAKLFVSDEDIDSTKVEAIAYLYHFVMYEVYNKVWKMAGRGAGKHQAKISHNIEVAIARVEMSDM